MRTLFILIRKFRNLLLFLALELIAISLIVRTRNIQGFDILSSSNAIVGFIYKQKSDVLYYFNLKSVNKELVEENAALRHKLEQFARIDTFQDAIASIPQYTIDTVKVIDSFATLQNENNEIKYKFVGEKKLVRYAEYQYLPARVVNSSFSNEHINFITINRGSDHGVKKDMAVVSTNGIVGRVSNVSGNYATVVAVISSAATPNSKNANNQLKVSAEINGLQQTVLTWKPGNPEYMVAEKLTLNLPISTGDPVYTTGYSYFPKDITIGHIARIDTIEANNNKTAYIKLTTNFRKLDVVYVVTSDFENERKDLEQQNVVEP